MTPLVSFAERRVIIMQNSNRLVYVDYLKVIGLLLIILAHVNAPDWLMQLRSFDVPLMVFVSAYLAKRSFNNIDIKGYYKKRILRLAVPAWIFLIVFYSAIMVAYESPSIVDVIKAFFFQRDAYMVGMLWVIWVYLVCAFIIPLINRLGYSKRSVVIVFTVYAIFELMCIFSNFTSNRLVYCTIMTVIPWGTVAFIGFNYDKFTRQHKLLLISVFAGIFCIIAIWMAVTNGCFVQTNEYKYPARIYYLSFAMPIIIVLFDGLKKMKIKGNKIVTFISGSSLWIYLWHILLLYVIKNIITNDSLWLLQYCGIIICASTVTLIQNIVVKRLMKRFGWEFLKIFLG